MDDSVIENENKHFIIRDAEQIGYTSQEFCDMLGISKTKFEAMIANGEAPEVKRIGIYGVILPDEVDRWQREVLDKAHYDYDAYKFTQMGSLVRTPLPAGRFAYSIGEFKAAFGIGVSEFNGLGYMKMLPRMRKLGDRIFILDEDLRQWAVKYGRK